MSRYRTTGRIGRPLPGKVAVGVLLRPAREAVAPAVGQGVLLDMEYEQPRMVVPEPDAAGRPELLHRALTGWAGAIGPPVPLPTRRSRCAGPRRRWG